MDEQRFDAELAEVAAGLRERRGSCPSTEEIAAHAAGELAEAAGERVAGHLRLCDACRQLVESARAAPGEVDEVTWRRAARGLDVRPAPWRAGSPLRRPAGRLGVVAAALVAVVGLVTWVAVRAPVPGRVSVTRGAGVQALEPVGEVARVEAFDWQAPPVALAWRLEVRRGDVPVWAGPVEAPPATVPEALRRAVRPGVAYRWRVEGRAEDGRAVVASDWVPLRLLPGG